MTWSLSTAQALLILVTMVVATSFSAATDDKYTAPLFTPAYKTPIDDDAGQLWLESIYYPSITSGPWSPAWSPDGSNIAFSMAGSLWIVSTNGGAATQITSDDNGYDAEPAWSPDGKQLAFTRDTGHAIELWLTNVDGTGARALTQNGGVNIDPRWRRHADQLLYVSSVGNANALGIRILSLATKQDRGLLADGRPALMPDWSADGTEIVFASSRPWRGSTIGGTGGLWKCGVEDKDPTLLLLEPTSWHARPVWSPDGRFIAYVSSRSGHNELWILPKDSVNPVQITYTRKQVFTPSWSPDGQRLVFVISEGNDSSLWTTAAWGGDLKQISITGLKYRALTGRLQVTISDSSTGKPIAARVYLKGGNGKAYTPRGSAHRALPSNDAHFFHTTGKFAVELPVGIAHLEIMRGFEYEPVSKQIEIDAGQTKVVSVALRRIIDMPARGWFGGDTHVHMNGGGPDEIAPDQLLKQAEAEDLHVTNSLIGNQGTGIRDLAYFSGKVDLNSRPGRLLYFAEEYRESFPGHIGLLNLKQFIFSRIVHGTRVGSYPPLSTVLDQARAQGAIVGLVHPFYGEKTLLARRSKEFPVMAALGKLQFYDVLCSFCDPFDSIEKWYHALNLGLQIPASAGTDTFADIWRNPAIGSVRVYVHAGNPFTYERWVKALAAGASFATNAPLLFLEVDGHQPGERLKIAAGSTVRVHAEAVSIVPIEKLEIVANGEVVGTARATNPSRIVADFSVTLQRSGWVAARVSGHNEGHLLMGSVAYAHTGPVYVQNGDQAVWSQADALFFLDWIDRLLPVIAAADCNGPSNAAVCFDTPQQRDEVLQYWREARSFYSAKH